MSSGANGSPYRRHKNDVEAGASSRYDYDDDEDNGGPFNIFRTKSAPIDRLKRWRQAALVLNASRRFRYTLDLKKEEERKRVIANIRKHAQVVRAAVLFKASLPGDSAPGTPKRLPSTPPHDGDFEISQEELAALSKEHDISVLQQYGGVKGVADKLKTNVEKGIHGDETDILKRNWPLAVIGKLIPVPETPFAEY